MELMDVSLWVEPEVVKLAIIPTVILPFTILGVLMTTLATFIAGLFGVKLKAEGPKKLLEILLKPRVLFTAALINLLSIGGYYGYNWLTNYPRFLWKINSKNNVASTSTMNNYSNNTSSYNLFKKFGNFKKISSVNEKWFVKIPGGSFGGALVTGDSILIGANDGYGYEINKHTGDILRKFYVGTPLSARPTIWNNSIYFAEGIHQTHHARVYKFDLTSGKLTHTYQSLGHIEGALVIHEHNSRPLLFVPTGKGGIVALNANDLSLYWHQNIGHVDSPVTVKGDMVFVTTGMEKGDKRDYQRAFALNINTGETIWRKELPASAWVSAVLYKSQICFGLGEVYQRRNYGQLTCVLQETGESMWAVNHDWSLIGRPIIIKDNIYFSDIHGGIYAYSLLSKKRLWHVSTKVKSLTYAPVSYNGHGHIVYPTVYDGVFFINAKTGEIEKTWKPEEKKKWAITLAPVTVENSASLYVVDWRGNVRQLLVDYIE